MCVCLIVKLPAVERDVPVLVDSEEHGGGGEGGQTGKLALAHLRLTLRHFYCDYPATPKLDNW